MVSSFTSYGQQVIREVTAAMEEVSEGRECRADFDSGNSRMSVGVRKADGWWSTTLVPLYTRDYQNPEDKLLAFMKLIPNNNQPISMVDRIYFAVEYTKAHCRD